ncbi:S41 family peptidase [Patescibacteria group bacterium]|nr:S41 family peptidase [Patescibacteria group bacterium]MBU1966703.1 S41 family peptidase [Patescibacteria group bacterium]MBU2542960.1 S41 family peptidase [Patescibacteria group bacterium]
MVKKKITIATLRSTILGVLLLALGGVVGYRYGRSGEFSTRIPLSQIINIQAPSDKQNLDFAVFWEVWGHLDQTYLEPEKLNAKEMVNGAISGMTAAIGDPYTTYLPPQQNQRSAEDLAGSFYGVGIELGYIDETLAVIAPLAGTPAEKAGIMAGDLILHLKDTTKGLDEDTIGLSLNEAVDKIRGEKNTKITLTLLRKNGQDNQYGEPFDVDIARGEIVVESIKLEFVEHDDKRVAHLKVSKFGERTPKEFDQAVGQILTQGYQLDGILLDLRNNPGGFFDDAIDLASEFIESGVVVSQKGKFTKQDFNAKGKARLTKFPLLVLVNRGSASASEILAGALRDQLNVKLIGENTFGKGTVQDRRELSNGGGLHVTIARWLLPKGDWINEAGIPVNVEVKDNLDTKEDEVVLRAIEEL